MLGFSSCVKESPKYTEGEPDPDGCYGVYFPNQDAAGDHSFDPSDPTTTTFKAVRTNSNGAITVPLTVTDTSANKVFEVGTLSFADGQSESTVTVNFPKAELGIKYGLSISIEDPQYASKYSSGDYGLVFSALREKWNSLGNARFREDCMTTFFGVENVEYEVEVQENDGVPGYYRLVYPYDGKYPYNSEGDWDTSQTYYFYIHAEDPAGVYIPVQETGLDWGYGMVSIGSLAGYQIANGSSTLAEQKDLGNTGTMNNKVITFPTRKLLIGMANYNSGSLYYANLNGKFRVILPGGIPTDYSLSVSSDYCSNGVVPVNFTAGVSVTSVKYAIYEGELDDIALAAKSEAIENGTDSSTTFAEFTMDSETEMNYGGVDISLDESGNYTLVAVSYADATAHEVASTNFNYVTAEDAENDEYAVDVHVGTEDLSERYEGTEYTSINSIAYYIYGNNLTEVHKAIVPTSKYQANKEAYDDVIKNNADPVSDSDLELINSAGGMATLYSGLDPLTSYTIIVWATNGQLDKIVTAERTTDGLPNVLLGTGTYSYDSGIWDEEENQNPHYSDSGLNLYKNPNYENTYLITPWSNNESLTFTMDPTVEGDTVAVKITPGYTGVSASGYLIYAAESADFASIYTAVGVDYPDASTGSYYVRSENKFHFNVIYLAINANTGNVGGFFAYGFETFTPDGSITLASLALKRASKELSKANVNLRVPLKEFKIERNYQPVKFTASARMFVNSSEQKSPDRTTVRKAEKFIQAD